MSVNRTKVDSAQLIEWAISHENAADACAAARRQHPQTIAAAASWGPLYRDARRAAVDAVNAREAALTREENEHRKMAATLRTAAGTMTGVNEHNAARLTIEPD